MTGIERNQTTAPHRFQARYRLRTLFVLTLLVAAYLAGRLPAERRAAEALRKAEIAEERAARHANVMAEILGPTHPLIRVDDRQ